LYKKELKEVLSIETVGKIWEMLNFSTCSVTVISSMRVDKWKGEGKCCPVTCQVSTEERLRYRSNHYRPGGQRGCVVSLMPQPLYPGKETQYLLYRRLGGSGAGLDGSGKSRTHRGSNPEQSSLQ